ncbi:hypothetical protein V1264_007745 [Littorina saxatilis]|uniref:Uncharacterized protein n=1 Tax=Littorina saxatilis TaxID=31220 RepID=A0AAN9AVK1_9CAEN
MKRFADLSREEIENKRRLLTPTTTQKATTSAAKVFRDYLAEKGKPVSFEQYEKKELDAALSSFYIEARTKTGEIYKKTSLDAVRYGINRHLKSSPQNKDFDILTDPSFASSNEMFKVAMREIKAQGKAAINHHPPMSDIDRNKLYNSIYLSQATPNGLYNKAKLKGKWPASVGPSNSRYWFSLCSYCYFCSWTSDRTAESSTVLSFRVFALSLWSCITSSVGFSMSSTRPATGSRICCIPS